MYEKKKQNMKKQLSLILSLLAVLLCTSCGVELDHARARELAVPLIEASQKLDEVLVGEGLALGEEKNGKYTKVASEEYKSVSDIKAAMAQVYTPELDEILRNNSLKGSTTEHGTIYSRYIDIDGALYEYDGAKVYVAFPRKYDFDSIHAVNMTDIRIIFTVDTYSADENGNYSSTPENIELKLLYDEAQGKWLLDTPTY